MIRQIFTVRRRGAAIACAAGVLGAVVFGTPGPASAIGPPTIDPGALGAAMAISGSPRPLEPTKPSIQCARPKLAGAPPADAPVAQRVMNLPAAWQFSRGAGQKVAVIDTGVNPHPRLPALQTGGDFVSDSDGTQDCDGHGTLVAGIIAARPSPDDGFAGVAPDAEILTIRQLSLAFAPENSGGGEQPGSNAPSGYGNVLTLAGAVVHAVDLGATVINISEVACSTAGSDTADAALGAAVKYAYDRNVVVVAAAGNVQSDGVCKDQNVGTGWDSVQTIASPAWFDPYVLSVGSVDVDGTASALSLNGPWIDVAAIGRDIVSLDSAPGGTGLVDSVESPEGNRPIEGTSFAAPYVSGLAALLRARFPELSAAQVIDRIVRTAHGPGTANDNRVGYGLIDPLAALTAELPSEPVSAGADTPRALPTPLHPQGPDPLPRRVAVIGSITCLVALGIGAAVWIPFRRRREDDNFDPDQIQL